jgi:hypothetical protein
MVLMNMVSGESTMLIQEGIPSSMKQPADLPWASIFSFHIEVMQDSIIKQLLQLICIVFCTKSTNL